MTPETVIITGAASGIGKHWATTLLKRSSEYRLVLADVNEQGLQDLFTHSENVRLHQLDIRSAEGWRKLVDDTVQYFGTIDYLFNIAGISRQSFFLSQPVENIDLVIDVILKGPLIGMRISSANSSTATPSGISSRNAAMRNKRPKVPPISRE